MVPSIIGFLFTILPTFMLVFVFRWIRFIYINSEEQIKQNKHFIIIGY
ncbi:hypothetical protein [Bacillus sp. S10(2024)]